MKMSSSKRDLVAQQLRASVEKRAAVSARDRFGRDHALFETQFTSARGALESLRRARETFESKQLISTYQRVVTATKTQFPKINYTFPKKAWVSRGGSGETLNSPLLEEFVGLNSAAIFTSMFLKWLEGLSQLVSGLKLLLTELLHPL